MNGPRGVLAATGTLAFLVGCSVDPDANPSHGCGECPAEFCYRGYCLLAEGGIGDGGFAALPDGKVVVVLADGNVIDPSEVDAGDAGDARDAGEGDAGPEPEPCTQAGEGDLCYDGPTGTSTLGLCKAGMHTCERAMPDAGLFFGPCLGQVLPEATEICNGQDDDCDDETDEEIPPASCDTGQLGACMAGVPTCQSGTEVCGRTSDPGPESCNGVDDDCDGSTDEGTSVACYPMGVDGCTGDAVAGFTCAGICAPGMRECVAGALLPCAGHTPPGSEDCGGSGTAGDENCDGMTDENCACAGSEVQACSTGGNPGVGECLAGTQTCNGSTFGACEGEVLPSDETCANQGQDNDCNDVDDDVPGHSDPCVDDNAQGVCRDGTKQCASGSLVCDTPAPAAMEACDTLDDDCDGKTDEDFAFTTDEANCGRCGNQCEADKRCCGSNCVDLETNEAHCGMCGMACGNGLTCCSSNCVNTDTDEAHCGMCGMQCSGLPACCVDGNCSSLLCL